MTCNGRGHAIVIGAGMAGLFAARALQRHVSKITLIERDQLPPDCAHRPGVPQSHHVHALLLRGLHELERLLPGIEQDLAAEGALRLDLGTEVAHCTEWGWAPRAHAIGIAPLTMSRLLMETVVRRRVLRDANNLVLLDDARVEGLIWEPSGEHVRVHGVRLEGGRELRADLVVDASGRNSRSLDWFARAHVAPPPEEVVDARAGYASRFYELAPSAQRWWRGMVIDAKPPATRRWGLLMPIEGGYHVLTVAGLNGDYPPSGERSFAEFLFELRSRELANEIARARPLSEIRTHRALSNRLRQYHRWGQRVGGFLAIGDSAVAFNAAHGQGTSMAAASANALDALLTRSPHLDAYELTKSFHRVQWETLKGAWQLATGGDMLWPGTLGRRPWGFRWTTAITVAVVRAAHQDPAIKRMIGPVYQLMKDPSSLLLRPDFLVRLLAVQLRRLARRGAYLPASVDAPPGQLGDWRDA